MTRGISQIVHSFAIVPLVNPNSVPRFIISPNLPLARLRPNAIAGRSVKISWFRISYFPSRSKRAAGLAKINADFHLDKGVTVYTYSFSLFHFYCSIIHYSLFHF